MKELGVYDIALLVGAALEQVSVEYMLTGSLVSGLQGHPRATNDIDFVVQLRAFDVPRLVEALGPDFDIDERALADAARKKSSWNIFHQDTVTRIDLFVAKEDDYQLEALSRHVRWEVRPGQSLFVISPEDTVLQKLIWFRAGGEVSDRQFRDVVDVLRVQESRLDTTYLDTRARKLGLVELLERARAASESGQG